jgi:hypothetical protein
MPVSCETLLLSRVNHYEFIPNYHDLAGTTKQESAEVESGVTDAPKAHPCGDGFGIIGEHG